MFQIISNNINKVFFTLILAIFLMHLTSSKIPEQTEVNFLDIGQGDAILIVTPELHTILIDGGPGESVLQQLGETLPFFAHDIDLMVLTHPHRDHMEGLLEVIQRYNVHNLLLAGESYNSSLYRQFLVFAREKEETSGLQIHFAHSINDIKVLIHDDELLFDILYPIDLIVGSGFDNENNASVVLKMTALKNDKKIGNSFLFTGDCERECEQEILKNYNKTDPATGINLLTKLDADVLKVGHHGSRTSSTQAFLDAISPKIAVIQVGVDNQFEHPHPETLQKLSAMNVEVHRNDLEGRIALPIYMHP